MLFVECAPIQGRPSSLAYCSEMGAKRGEKLSRRGFSLLKPGKRERKRERWFRLLDPVAFLALPSFSCLSRFSVAWEMSAYCYIYNASMPVD